MENRSIKNPQSVKARVTPLNHHKETSRIDAISSTAGPALAVSSVKAPPKKGSFAEIMARAKQNQGGQIGGITHKPKDKLPSKKELVAEKELFKKMPSKGVNGKDPLVRKTNELTLRNAPHEAKASEKGTKPSGYQGTSRSANKAAVVPGYRGTAKAKPRPGYQGTTKAAASSKKAYHSDPEQPRRKTKSKPTLDRRRRASYDEEESEGQDSEDPYTYASEDYSDMDAGFDDLEEEDEEAARIARKEDAMEQARLDRLKQDKEKKKAALTPGKKRN